MFSPPTIFFKMSHMEQKSCGGYTTTPPPQHFLEVLSDFAWKFTFFHEVYEHQNSNLFCIFSELDFANLFNVIEVVG